MWKFSQSARCYFGFHQTTWKATGIPSCGEALVCSYCGHILQTRMNHTMKEVPRPTGTSICTKMFACQNVGCHHSEVKTAHIWDGDTCLRCKEVRPYTHHSSRLTSDIERDPDADEHEWLGSDINLRR